MNRLEAYRLCARKLVEYACGDTSGRSESDPVYQRVTEGRDVGAAQAKYSSCGDLAHWMLYRLGARESFVNRAENKPWGWRVGRNVSQLCYNKLVHEPKPGERFAPGDILVVFNDPGGRDAHVLVALEHNGDVVLSGDYGQPGGALRTRTLRDGRLGGRELQYCLPLGMALSGTMEAPDWGLLETLMTGEELDAVAEATGFALAREPLGRDEFHPENIT